jgi:hypothetical protein
MSYEITVRDVVATVKSALIEDGYQVFDGFHIYIGDERITDEPWNLSYQPEDILEDYLNEVDAAAEAFGIAAEIAASEEWDRRFTAKA